jgi:hypothetical protein
MPSSGAVRDLRELFIEPTGVREAATMTASFGPKVLVDCAGSVDHRRRAWLTHDVSEAGGQ